jgi:hypothetical protein
VLSLIFLGATAGCGGGHAEEESKSIDTSSLAKSAQYPSRGNAGEEGKGINSGGKGTAQPFQHPGILVSKAQLDYIRAMVATGQQPFHDAFRQATHLTKTDVIGSLNYQVQGPPAGGIIDCGSKSQPNTGSGCVAAEIVTIDTAAAYLQALLWYITGNKTYANNAIKILNVYARNLKGYTNSNEPLEAAWGAQILPRAAEIIRYTNAGWADSDITQFKKMLDTVVRPRLINGSGSNGNWEISMIEGLMNIGIFNDDHATFDLGVTYWKQRIPAYFYYHTDGAAPVPLPRGMNYTTWNGQITFDKRVDGISQETCRDFGHAQYGLAGALNAAETAYIQGVDLYNDAESKAMLRLTSALEFHAKYLLAYHQNNRYQVPAYVCNGDVKFDLLDDDGVVNFKLKMKPTYEIGYNNYHNRQNISLPSTKQYLDSVIRPILGNQYHVMIYETLTHSGDAVFGQR